jgi:squalene cyclase
MLKISCSELVNFLNKAINEKGHKESEEFSLNIGKKFKDRGYLTPLEVFYFICWKSYPNKVPSAWLFWQIENQENVKKITHKAFQLVNQNRIKEAVEELIKLKGIKVRTASAILTFLDPNKFGTIDKFAWKALYNETKEEFNSDDYIKYLKDIREIAKKCNIRVRDVDLALWKKRN